MKPDRSRASRNLVDAVLRARRDRRMRDEKSLHRAQIDVAAELSGANIKHGEIVAAGARKEFIVTR